MIIDAVLFNNEFDILEFRLQLLWRYVDKFVIVEADKTFSGSDKPWNFISQMDRFYWAKEKIVYHGAKIDMSGLDLNYVPASYEPDAPQWKIENQQRNSILEACNEFPDDSIIMLSDCDEIPSHAAVEFRRDNNLIYPMTCDQTIIPYHLGYARDDIGWRGTVMSDLGYVRQSSFQWMRDNRASFSPFPSGGWHLSFFGGAGQIKNKIQSYAHQEFNKPEFTDIEYIEETIKNGNHLFKEEASLRKVDKSFYPKYFIDLAPESWWP